jgi:2'-5' RNA ligase
MRLFYALFPPPEICARLAEIQHELKKLCAPARLTWTQPDQFHFTVRFIGECSLRQAEAALEAGITAAYQRPPITLEIGGIGAFPNLQRPTVFWTGALRGSDAFLSLAETLEAALRFRRFAPDRRGAKPHITLARAKTYDGEEAAARALRTYSLGEVGTFTADRLLLMQSRPSQQGSVYSVVREIPLEPAQPDKKE